jgi:hypothetical protein
LIYEIYEIPSFINLAIFPLSNLILAALIVAAKMWFKDMSELDLIKKLNFLINKNTYSWTATTGLTINGICAHTCTPATPALTGDINTYGVTCSGKQFGNELKSSASGKKELFKLKKG